jgi:hypothetical protein
MPNIMVISLSIGDFYGIDSFVELLMVVVALIIFFYSRKVYKIINNKNYKYFSFAFLSIAIAYIFKILSNLTIKHVLIIEKANLIFTFTSQMRYMEAINFFSYMFYKTFSVIGFLILFLILTKTDKKEKVFMFIYMSLIVVFFSVYYNFIFHRFIYNHKFLFLT